MLEQEGFVVPPGYGGAAGQAVEGGLAVAAARRASDHPVAREGRWQPVATVTLRGIRGRVSTVSGLGSIFDGVLVRWREQGVVSVASVLGHNQLHQQLAMAVAEHVRVVSPGRHTR
jgi:hypothetical protein